MFAGDLLNIQSVRKAMRGIEKVYFCYPVQEGLLEATPILAEAAREEGVKFVFHFSLGTSSDQSLSPWGRKMLIDRLFPIGARIYITIVPDINEPFPLQRPDIRLERIQMRLIIASIATEKCEFFLHECALCLQLQDSVACCKC